MSKGDYRRPEDFRKFQSEYDRIFRKHVHACHGCCSGAHPNQPHECECGLQIPADASWEDYNK